MRYFKLPKERVMARDFDRQAAELQMRAALLISLRNKAFVATKISCQNSN